MFRNDVKRKKMKNKTLEKLNKFLYLLQVLKKSCRGKDCHKKFHNLVSFLDEKSLQFLAECVRNSLSPNTVERIPSKKRARLISVIKPHKKEIKEIIKPKISIKRKRDILQRGSGWFLPLLSTVIPLISSLVGGGGQ